MLAQNFFGKAAIRFAGRNFNPDIDDILFSSENGSYTAASTRILLYRRRSGNLDRHPSNSGKSFSFQEKKPPDRVASLPSSWHAGSFMSLYNQLCSYENLLLAYKKARKRKTAKWYVKKFEESLEQNLIALEKELTLMTYKPSPMKTFVIHDPKTRLISSSHFRDRVVHHAICNVIEPIFEKSFIFDSYGSRKGKGTHAALKRFDHFKRKASKNGRLVKGTEDKNTIIGYCLKADIKQYFATVDHEILLAIIRKKISDEKVLWLIKKILDNHECKIPGKGMPIGNLTSQFFANVYLNELDYFVKHRLKAKYYIRYVDDFVVLDASKERLESYKAQINEFLKTIKLELHPDKSKIMPLHKGIKLLGFRIFYKYKLPKKGSARRMIHRIEHFIDLHKDGIMDKPEILECIEGWNAYAMHANTYKFRRHLMNKLRKSLTEISSE